MLRRLAGWMVLSLMLAGRTGIAADSTDRALEPILLQLRAAREQCPLPTSDDLRRSIEDVREAASRLDTLLSSNGENGCEWRRYLRWDQLETHLADGASSGPDELAEMVERLSADHLGLEREEFLGLRESLGVHVRVLRGLKEPAVRSTLRARLDELETLLIAYRRDQRASQRERIAECLGWMEARGAASAVVAAVRKEFSRANLLVSVHERLVADLLGPVEEDVPLRDVILKADIVGRGTMKGTFFADMVPSPRGAVIDLVFQGATDGRTVGYQGPIRIHSLSTTEVAGRKRVLFDAAGLKDEPVQASARNRSRLVGVTTTFRGVLDRVARRIARHRHAKQHALADWIASQHAQQSFRKRMEGDARSILATANALFLNAFRYPLLRVGQFPRQFELQTTDQELHLTVLKASASQLGAPSAPPKPAAPAALTIQFHETVVNNVADDVLAGATISDLFLEKELWEMFSDHPKQETSKTEEQLAVVLADEKPIELIVDDGEIAIVVRGRRFITGKGAFPPMNVKVAYRLEALPTGYRAVLAGPPSFVPPRFTAEGPNRYSFRETALRRVLKNRFDRDLPKQLTLDEFEIPLDDDTVVGLKVEGLLAQRGWLVCALSPSSKAD